MAFKKPPDDYGDFFPGDFLDFIELQEFSAAWEELSLTDDDLLVLQSMIMRNPQAAPVIRGTGGLRKLRFSPRKWKRGKRGGLRICYAVFEKLSVVLLALVYTKAEKDDLNVQEKRAIRLALEEIESEYSAFRGDQSSG